MVFDHHVHLVLHVHVHHYPYQHIHLQFVVDLDNPFVDIVAYKDHIVVVVVDNHQNKVYHHRHRHGLTIHWHLLDDLQ
jgi:hypothetical protein